MAKISVNDLKVGDRFSKPVYTDAVNVLVEAGVAIRNSDVERLKKWGITEVETSGEKLFSSNISKEQFNGKEIIGDYNEDYRRVLLGLEKIINNKENFKSIYLESVKTTEFLYKNFRDPRKFKLSLIREQIDKFVDLMTRIEDVFLNLLFVETPGPYLYHHSVTSAIYSILIGQILEYSRPKLVDLGVSAIFADVGMTLIKKDIIDKTNKLTDDEFREIKKHPLLGYQVLTKEVKMKNNLAIVALQHHEAYDGSGYPQGLKENNIEESARIVKIADSFSAQLNSRNYRDKLLRYNAMNHALSVDLQQYDPVLLRKFLGRLSIYPIGSVVELSTKEIGIVIKTNQEKPLRPVIKILIDENGTNLENKIKVIDLMQKEGANIYIIKALSPDNLDINIEAQIL